MPKVSLLQGHLKMTPIFGGNEKLETVKDISLSWQKGYWKREDRTGQAGSLLGTNKSIS